jgi:hypothetical protein
VSPSTFENEQRFRDYIFKSNNQLTLALKNQIEFALQGDTETEGHFKNVRISCFYKWKLPLVEEEL